jgi:hypothetical protein
LRHKGPIRTRFNFEVKNVRGIFPVEDEQDLGEDSLAVGGFDDHDLVYAGLEE